MKKNKILFTAMLFFSITAAQLQGQNLVIPGNTWSVVECIGTCYSYYLKFEGDTTINNTQYQVLLKSYDSLQANWYYETCMRETEDKKVYRWDGANEILYYDFGLQEGDVFSTTLSDITIQMPVEYTDTITLLNGEKRERINFPEESWIEGIGSTLGIANMGMYQIIFDVYFGLNCFTENDILKYDDLQLDGCYHVSVGIDENTAANFHIIPNPAFQKALIKFPSNNGDNSYLIQIFDYYGRQIHTQKTNKGQQDMEINVSSWPPGIYIAVAYAEGSLHGKLKFVVR